MSSYDDPLARMCYRKKAMAENYAKMVVASARGAGAQLHAYQCPACSLWHVSNDMTDDGERKVGRYGEDGERT